jgi:hypothetical protein
MCIYSIKPLTEITVNNFKPTRLCIKELAGIYYFCKSIKDNIDQYTGSGIIWKKRIKKYGKNNIKTLWISDWYTSAEEIQVVALGFSKENDIVNSDKWANLVPENGIDGGNRWTPETNPFRTREDGTNISTDRVKKGTHQFLKRSDGTSFTSERTKLGLNPLSKRANGTSVASDRVKAKTHNFLGGGLTRKNNAARIKAGTHNFLDPVVQKLGQEALLKYRQSDRYVNPSNTRCSCIYCHKETNVPGLNRNHKNASHSKNCLSC